jgi:uncharacterized membrane protein
LGFCTDCGVQVFQGNGLCPICRKPVPGEQIRAQARESDTRESGAMASAMWDDRLAAAASYCIPILPVVFLLIPRFRRSPLVRFHALQSLLFQAALLLVGAVLALIVLSWFSGMIVLIIWPIYAFAVFVIWALLVAKAAMAEIFQLPLLGWVAIRGCSA